MGAVFSKPKPKVQGPTEDQKRAQAAAEKRAADQEERANKELSSATRATRNRRTGRRLLLAPGREDEISRLGGGTGNSTGANM